MKGVEHGFAIVRVDPFASPQIGGPGGGFYFNITVKEIVWSIEEAQEEVSRLNELNKDLGCHYFWQTTRVKVKK